jgi:hypothetical protein
MVDDAGGVELLEVAAGELVGADLVVEEVNADAGLRAVDEGLLEALADAVVFDDVEVDQEVVLGGGDGFEDGLEGLLAVDEQGQFIAAGEGQSAEDLRGAAEGVVGLDLVVAEAAVHVFGQLAELGIHAAAGAPVGGDGDPRDGEQRDDPGDGALGGPHRHDGVDDVGDAERVEQQEFRDEEVGEVVGAGHGGRLAAGGGAAKLVL